MVPEEEVATLDGIESMPWETRELHRVLSLSSTKLARVAGMLNEKKGTYGDHHPCLRCRSSHPSRHNHLSKSGFVEGGHQLEAGVCPRSRRSPW